MLSTTGGVLGFVTLRGCCALGALALVVLGCRRVTLRGCCALGALALVVLGCRRDGAPPVPVVEPASSTTSSASTPSAPAAAAPAPEQSAPSEKARTAEACAAEALDALRTKDMGRVADLAHPSRGVRFTPFAFARPEDVVLQARELRGAASDGTVRNWGQFGEGEEPIRMTFAKYHARFVYDADYAHAPAAPAGTTDPRESASFNVPELRKTLQKLYPGGRIFEYRVPPKTAGGIDWRVLRLVCEPVGDVHHLVAVVHSEWTP